MYRGGVVVVLISIESVNEETDEFEKERGENKLFSSFPDVVAVVCVDVADTGPAVTAALILL
ncbi:hypothetical protein HPULCUR_000669 [Helicostylum pulchrum]|uniref:Uncharacterized protein n=1 Tax=Helicostylum pulchrum TaxID=562976 RepID=A0ABP9XKI4_9FUNG